MSELHEEKFMGALDCDLYPEPGVRGLPRDRALLSEPKSSRWGELLCSAGNGEIVDRTEPTEGRRASYRIYDDLRTD